MISCEDWDTSCHRGAGADPKEETLVHLFFTSKAATTMWRYFLMRTGVAMEGLPLNQAITKCWTAQVLPRIKPIMQALPSCIV